MSLHEERAQGMNLYLISQSENDAYDTYDSAVVCAESEDHARDFHPRPGKAVLIDWSRSSHNEVWCKSRDSVNVRLIGTAAEGVAAGVLCASFNAG